MASRGRRDRDPERSSGRGARGQGDGPGPSGHRDGWSQPDERTAPEPGGWSGPDDFAEADPGPETGHWQFDPEDDRDGDGTAAWDGPMAWEDDQQGATWVEDGGGQGGGTWEQDVPPTTYSTWEADRSRPSPYGYESSYPTAYMGPGGGPGCDQRRPHEPGQVAFFVEHACPRHRLSHNKHDSSPHLLGPALEVVNSATPNHDGAASHDHCGRGRKGAEPPGYGGRGKLPHPLVARHQPDLGSKDVAGTQPGEVYYADQPASATYWALVEFKPSATLLEESSTAAGQEKLAEFQNSVYAFSWKSGPVWTLLGEANAGSCPGVVPAPVLKVWGMCGL